MAVEAGPGTTLDGAVAIAVEGANGVRRERVGWVAALTGEVEQKDVLLDRLVPFVDAEQAQVAALFEVHGDHQVALALLADKLAGRAIVRFRRRSAIVAAGRRLVQRDGLTVELHVDVAFALCSQAFEAGVYDEVALIRVRACWVTVRACSGSRGTNGPDVGVREVVLRGVVAGIPVPGRDQVVVLVGPREDRVVFLAGLGEVVHEEGRGLAAKQVNDVPVGVEDGSPVRPIGGVAVFNDIPFELEDVVVMNGRAAANIDSEPGSYG